MKQVEGEFYVCFTTDNASELPSSFQMKNDLQELFAAALDKYLSDKNIEGNEIHLITENGFTIDDYEE